MTRAHPARCLDCGAFYDRNVTQTCPKCLLNPASALGPCPNCRSETWEVPVVDRDAGAFSVECLSCGFRGEVPLRLRRQDA